MGSSVMRSGKPFSCSHAAVPLDLQVGQGEVLTIGLTLCEQSAADRLRAA